MTKHTALHTAADPRQMSFGDLFDWPFLSLLAVGGVIYPARTPPKARRKWAGRWGSRKRHQVDLLSSVAAPVTKFEWPGLAVIRFADIPDRDAETPAWDDREELAKVSKTSLTNRKYLDFEKEYRVDDEHALSVCSVPDIGSLWGSSKPVMDVPVHETFDPRPLRRLARHMLDQSITILTASLTGDEAQETLDWLNECYAAFPLETVAGLLGVSTAALRTGVAERVLGLVTKGPLSILRRVEVSK